MKDLLTRLSRLGITLEAEGTNINIYDPQDLLTEELLGEIRGNKAKLLGLLGSSVQGQGGTSIQSSERRDWYPLSAAQRGLYVLHRLDPGSTVYNVSTAVVVVGSLDEVRLGAALQSLVARHEALRTYFQEVGGEPVQRVSEGVIPRVECIDVQGGDLYSAVRLFMRPFDLGRAPLLRVGLAAVGSGEHLLLLDVHHIITDGISQSLLVGELLALYDRVEFSPARLQYRDHALWQHAAPQREALSQHRTFWAGELLGSIRSLDLPTDHRRPAAMKRLGAIVVVELSAGETAALRTLAAGEGVTLFAVLLSAYALLLAKLGDTEDLVVGIPASGRQHADLERVIGMFVNTLPVRLRPQGNMIYRDFLAAVSSQSLACLDHQVYPYDAMVGDLGLERDPSRNPLFDVMFSYQAAEATVVAPAGLSLRPYTAPHETSRLDLSLVAQDTGDRIRLQLEYSTELFRGETADRITSYLKSLLSALPLGKDQQLSALEILSEQERRQLLHGFNVTHVDHSGVDTMLSLFDAQVRALFNKRAIVHPVDVGSTYQQYGVSHEDGGAKIIHEGLTYGELDSRAGKLARYLVSSGVQPGDIVGLMLDPSLEMIVGILAILKAGGAFLPISPELPESRISFMLKDSGCGLMLMQEHLLGRTTFDGIQVDIEDSSSYLCGEGDLVLGQSQESPLYVIYTSGTTGTPKGVLIKHVNLVNYVNWFRRYAAISEQDSTMLVTSFAFDLGYTSLFTSILSGAELHVMPKSIYMSPSSLLDYIHDNGITYMKLTPLLYSTLVGSPSFTAERIQSLRVILLGGEKIRVEDVRLTQEVSPRIRIINHYGPTEATIGCVTHEIDPSRIDEYSENPTIGRPIDNARAYILGVHHELLPIGVAGQLCIAGRGLGAGYLNRPELTAEKFAALGVTDGERVYQTGDRARYLPDGTISFLGRVDSQVKVSGYRVELGEIEQRIRTTGLVGTAVVLPVSDADGGTALCAYFTANADKERSQCIAFTNHHLENNLCESAHDENAFHSAIQKLGRLAIRHNGRLIPAQEVDNTTLKIAQAIRSAYEARYSLSKGEKVRYKRQTLLKGWGVGGQERLKSAKVFVAGAGGGASPTIMQLALAGFGIIVVCDFDVVELSNLNRQVLHDESRIGMNKALSAQLTIERINPNVRVIPITEKITKENVHELVGDSDMIFDMLDGQQDKFILSECAVAKGIPHLVSAMTDINSYAAVFHPPHGPCFHCVFDRDRLDSLIMGMRGSRDGYQKDPLAVVATSLFQSSSIAVNEAIKYALGIGSPAHGRFFYINQRGSDQLTDSPSYQSMIFAYSDHFKSACRAQGFDWESGGWRGKFLEELEIARDPECPICSGVSSELRISAGKGGLLERETLTTTLPEGCVALLFDDLENLALSAIGAMRSGVVIVMLDSQAERLHLARKLDLSNSRVIVTSMACLGLAEELRNAVNRNIAVVCIDGLSNGVGGDSIKAEMRYDDPAHFRLIGVGDEHCFETYRDLLASPPFLSGSGERVLQELLYQLVTGAEELDISRIGLGRGSLEQEIRGKLTRELPLYMVPTHFVEVDELPLTPNGKIDMKRLPSPSSSKREGREVIPPKNSTESVLLEIWATVLGLDKTIISTEDNFFSIGGQSIKVIMLDNEIHRRFHRKVGFSEIFGAPTIRSLASTLDGAKASVYLSIGRAEQRQHYPLSFAQKRMYLLQQMDLGSIAYNIPYIMPLGEKRDRAKITEVFHQLISRHESFRTSFKLHGGIPVQEIHEKVNFRIEEFTIEKTETQSIQNQFIKAFDLSKAPLIRAAIVEVKGGDDLLLLDMHHIIGDAVSNSILEKEFQQLYQGEELPSLKLQYKDYSEWQNSKEYQEGVKVQEDYWMKRFEGEIPVLALPADYARPSVQSYEGTNLKFVLSKEETTKLRSMAEKNGITLYMSLLSVFTILLSRLSGQEDIVIGTPVAGRNHVDLNSIVGLFVNTLAIRTKIRLGMTLQELIREVKHNTLEAFEHQDYPFEDLVEKVSVNRDLSRNPLFDVMFNMLNQEKYLGDLSEFNAQVLVHTSGISKFDLSLTAVDYGERLLLSMSYCTKLFKPESVERYSEYLRRIIEEVSKDADKTISELEMLSAEERHQLLYRFNDTERDYPKDKTIYQLFEEQVGKTPKNVAVITKDRSINYAELRVLSEKLSEVISSKGVLPGSVVGIMVDRSVEMIVGIMGILRAGCCYLPIAPNTPVSRLKFLIEDSESHLILTQINHQEKLRNLTECINLDDLEQFKSPKSLIEVEQNPNALAYIIYTSGSTGNPKGVMIENHSVVNRLKWMQKQYPIGSGDIIMQKTPYTFDVSVWELFWWSLEGGSVYMLEPEGEKDAALIARTIEERKINVMHFVPSMLEAFLNTMDVDSPGYSFKSIKYVFSSGEALKPNQVNGFYKLFAGNSHAKLINLYGPTEATVDVSYYDCERNVDYRSIPIGKPIDNIQLYVLDGNTLNLQPVGVAGELMISGVGLSRGYVRQNELTAEKFIDHPFRKGEKLYSTGDLARWLPDGNIEYLGRIDHQVKIRGFRIELGEIENLLAKHKDINDCVVVARDANGDKHLCAYIVANSELTTDSIRSYLLEDLPEYMVPAHFVFLDHLPLTSSGKVDRKALPVLEIKAEASYTAPSNPIEEKLVLLWSEVLNLQQEEIGVNTNFFSIGGHSLKATILTSRIHKEFKVKIPLAEIFSRNTIKELAKYISTASSIDYSSIDIAEKREYYSLSSAQKRLFFLQQLDLNSISYNMPFVVPLDINYELDKLEETFRELINRHQGFRTSFITINNIPVQRIHDTIDFRLEVIDAKEEEVTSLIHSVIRPFNLASDNLLRAYILKIPEKQDLLVVDMHHIISDGTTGIIVVEDFLSILEGHVLPPLKLQYKDFSLWQNKLIEQGKIANQENYWKNTLSGDLPQLNLLTDYKRPDTFTFKGDIYNFTISEDTSEKLLKLGEERRATLFMNALAILNVLFYKYTNQTDIIIGSGIAGRPHADLQRISGMFVNMLAMRNRPSGEKTYIEFLDEVIQNSINAFDNQDVQFEDLIDKLNIERNPSRNPLFDISMVVQNFAKNNVDQPATTSDENSSSNQNLNYRNTTSKFDMTFFIREGVKGINFIIEYYSDIFNRDSIIRISNHFQNLVNIITNNPSIKLDEIDILSKEEKQTLVEKFNDTEVDYLKNKTFHQNFEQIVEIRPDAVAIAFQDCHITYKQLNEKANQLGNYLHKECNIGKDDLVGIYLQRSALQIISILGVFKSGGAYVPIDTSLPEERIRTIINDSRLKVLISQKSFNRELNRLQWMCKNLDTYICLDSDEILNEKEVENNELMDPRLWEYVGETATDEITGGGWTSSYTGEPLSQQEMNEYGDNILQKVLPLVNSKSRVLEIGCASGISMFRIAPHVSYYCGTDISNVIISKNRERANKENFENIGLKTLAAHELDLLGEDNFDLIIINSVIQCFNGHNYLRKVIKKSIELLSNKGFIFLGDVMDQDLKEELQQSLEEFRRDNKEKPYKTKIDLSSELFVAKEYIADLQVDIPEIIDINFSNKIHTIKNELTKYRYDAVIKIDKTHRSGVVNRHKSKRQHDLKILENYSLSNLNLNSSAQDLAYIIYTSGTTGTPKGVMIEHRGLSNLQTYYQKEFGIDHHDKVFQFANLSFDASVSEIIMALLEGACLTLLPEGVIADKGLFENYIERYAVTVVTLPPPYLNLLDKEKINTVRLLLTAGSETNANLVNHWNDKVQYINAYGPTETTICSTVNLVDKAIKLNGSVSIGKPIYNAKVFILNKNNQLQTIGVAGELCVSGDILSRGYLYMPELTAQKFVPNPFLNGELMYRTGDLARWLNDGNIEFLGRIDDQVKVRGYRIELGEIESHLQKHEDIKENVVISIEEDGDTYICAYYVSDNEIESSHLVDFLAKTLPRYMIPQYFMHIAYIPLNSSGKVNRKLLPLPKEKIKGSYLAPESNAELKLLKIWSDILGIKENLISADANFFEIGGHSLRATTLVSRIHKEFQVQFELRSVFQHQTIREQAVLISQLEQKEFISIPKSRKKDHYQLTSAQKRLFLLQQLDLKSTAYNLPYIITLDSMLDKQRVEKAFQQLITRHESFRTSFEFVDNLPVQIIHDNVDFEVNTQRISKINIDQVRDSFISPFNLSKAPLLRVTFVDVIDSNPLLMIDMHHIISDGTSHTILEREFNSLYNGQELKPIKLQYRDFSEWQNSPEQLDRIKGQEKYWLDRFNGELPILSLTTDYSRPPIQGSEGATARFTLPQDLTDGLKKMASDKGLTLYMSLLGAYAILLSKLSGQEDIVVGTPIAGRRHADLESVVGMFVNTLALRIGLSQDQQIKEYYKILKGYTLEAFENQEYQFEDLVDKLALNRDLSRNPLFDVMFNLLNQTEYGLISGRTLPNTIVHEKGTSKFDLNLAVADFGNQLLFQLEYSTKLFSPERIDRFIEYFKRIINQLIEKTDGNISDVELVNHEEREELLQRLNSFNADYPREKGIHELFEEQVARYSNRVAIVVDGKEISYESLNNLADQLAGEIISKGVDSGSIVGIMSERSLEMVISIFGVLKAGCAYLPISLDYPQDRINYMLQDSNCQLVLVDESQRIEDTLGFELLSIKTCLAKNKVNQKETRLVKGESISHVLYTSGSTGRPKGVVIPHRVLVNSMVAMEKYYPVGLGGAYLLKTPYVFDVSTSELFGWFLGGGRLVISHPDAHKDPLALMHMIKNFGISHINFVPSMLNIFLNYLEDNNIVDLGHMKYIFAAGEELTTETVNRFYRLINGVRLVNIYGPTESFYVTHYSLDSINDCVRIPIGIEFSNIKTYVVDKANHLQPLGIPGEICIGGDGLAIGYLNNPELTHSKFVVNPFAKEEVYYRTGDLGLLKQDGNIEFLGRIDHQVKIRGFRIELGEIDNTLRKHEGIRESIVIVHGEGSEKSLCAYLVTERMISPEEIRTYLHNYLPDYMIPTYFIFLDELPLNSNGKVDRKALPMPALKADGEYIAPSSAIEERLAKLWSEVLGIPQDEISMNANFFSIGGHSLKATILISKIQKEFDVLLPLREIFQSPTISAIATILFQMTEVESYVDRVEF